jgi:hypothetical protein
MNNHLMRLGQAINNVFRLIAIVVLICIISIANFSTAFADSHESEGEAAEEKPMEEKPNITGWFQVDVDSLGTYFLIGATHPLGGVSLDSNIYVNDHFGEFDFGVSLPVVKSDNLTLILLPMLGVGFDYTTANGPDSLFPQIFAFLPAGKIYGFHWTIGTVRSIFNSESLNELYTRNYLTYALNETVAVGPQAEAVLGLGDGGGLWALNFGGRVNIGYGQNNTLGLYLGYETKKEEGETGLTGRMNFTRTW